MQHIQQLLSRINLLYLCPFVQKILHLSLILCLVALTPMSAYAAGDSLTSSISLSFNSTKKFQLEAYEHFYAYYTVPSSYSRTKNTLSVTVSNLSNFSVSVMNSDGSSISTTRKKNILYFKNNAFIAENRYFIKIHNQRNIVLPALLIFDTPPIQPLLPKQATKTPPILRPLTSDISKKALITLLPEMPADRKPLITLLPEMPADRKPLRALIPEMPAGRKALITLLPEMPADRKPLRALLPGMPAGRKPLITLLSEMLADRKPLITLLPGKEKQPLRIMRPPLPKNMYLPAPLFPLLLQPYTIFGSRKELLSH